MRQKGKIKTWHDDKGFGFIRPHDGGPEVFIHIKAFGNRKHRPAVNDVVTYSVTQDKQGRTRAVNATRPGEKRIIKSSKRRGAFSALLPVIFLAIVGASTAVTGLPIIVPVAYLVLSLITYFVYAWDKAAAQSGHWRTEEATLHLLSLAGGWPGAMLAQRNLRHKSKKTSFRVNFWITVLLNCAALVWLQTSESGVLLQKELRELLPYSIESL